MVDTRNVNPQNTVKDPTKPSLPNTFTYMGPTIGIIIVALETYRDNLIFYIDNYHTLYQESDRSSTF